MRASFTLSSILLVLAVSATAQNRSVRGTVTYVAGDAVYISIGRDSGVRDSALVFALSGRDTIAVLRIFATSSKSAACRSVESKRQPVIGDVVAVRVFSVDTVVQAQEVQPVKKDTLSRTIIAPAGGSKARPSLMSVQGRISLQIAMIRQSNPAPDVSQPGVLVNLRGKMNELPIRFEFSGNFRSSLYAASNQNAGFSINQTRIYKMSLEFDDGATRVSVGRTMPPASASVGYLDGAVISRIVGGFTFGAGGGFEPAFSQRTLSTDFRKFLVFGSYRSEGPLPVTGSVAYSRIYFHSSIDREVSSASLNIDPSNELHLWAQTDVDLRMVRNGNLVMRPNVTNLFAMANYRLTGFLSVGAGMSAWRPTYSYSSVSMLADSLLDKSLRSSPTASLSLSLPGNVSFFNNYSPRSSDAGWGKEFSNSSSVAISNILNSGAGIRGTMNVNSGATTTTRGYGASAHRTILDFCDLTVRYQYYRYTVLQNDQLSRSKSFATDLMLSPWRNFALWASVERFLGLGADATNIFTELSWSF